MTIRVEHNGERISLLELSRRTGVPDQVIYMRYNAGDRGERLLRLVRRHSMGGDGGPLLASELRPQADPQFDALLAQWRQFVEPWSVKAMR